MIDTSDSNLKMGLELVGRQTLGVREWTGKFAELQHLHQYPAVEETKTKFGSAVAKSFQKFKLHMMVCNLCLGDKPKSQFYHLCTCSHSYCFSCLNSYAISRIEDGVPVVCPHENCGEVMPIGSKIYHYLPDEAKIKYLQNKSTFKLRKNKVLNKQEAAELCQRCLEPKHIGQCKYVLSIDGIQKSFTYRQCPYCKVEINMTEGKKKIKCSRCHKYSCYLCGQGLQKKSSHSCSDREKIKQIQKQQQTECCVMSTACANCDCDCCNCCECCDCECNCGCDCCTNCVGDLCCQILFHFDTQCSLFCILWNLLSIPIRIALSSIIVAMMLGIGGLLLGMGCTMWLVVCMIGAIVPIPMEIICHEDTPCPVRILMVIFYPITIIISFGIAVKESHEAPCQVFGNFFGMYFQLIGSLWKDLSPHECLR